MLKKEIKLENIRYELESTIAELKRLVEVLK